MYCKLNHIWKSLVVLILSGLCHSAVAQDLNKLEWAKGELITTNGDTLLGALTYYYTKEIIQVKGTDGMVRTFSPVNVARFLAFNEQKQIFHIFRPYMWSANPDDHASYKTPVFFEVVTEGKYTLMKRSEYVIRNSDPIPSYTTMGRYYEPCYVAGLNPTHQDYQIALLNYYYLLTPENKIIPLRNPRKNMEHLYQDKAGTMDTYIKWQKLTYTNPVALSRMVRYFNQL